MEVCHQCGKCEASLMGTTKSVKRKAKTSSQKKDEGQEEEGQEERAEEEQEERAEKQEKHKEESQTEYEKETQKHERLSKLYAFCMYFKIHNSHACVCGFQLAPTSCTNWVSGIIVGMLLQI